MKAAICVRHTQGNLSKGMIMKMLRQFSFFLLALLLAGCATVRRVKVDAISSGSPATAAFHIVPANPELSPGDLRFKEASRIVAKALEAKGYSESTDAASAGIVIALDTSVSEPRSVSVTRTDSFYDPFFYASGRVPVRTRSGAVVFVRTSYWHPSPAFYETTTTETYYDMRLSLTAFAPKVDASGDLPQLWSVIVTSREANSDLRKALPSLAVAAVRHVGEDTHGEILVSIGGDDPEVVRIAPAQPEKDAAK
jgi:hypothetical protein